MIKYYSINGELVPKAQASLGVTDLAIQRGYGLFDYFVVKKGQPVFFEDYLDRVEQSAKWLHLALPVTREVLREQVMRLIRANGEREAGIKIILTGGYADDGYSPEKPNLVILEMPPPTYPASKFEQGVKLMLYEHHRTFPSAKSINYIVGRRVNHHFPGQGAVNWTPVGDLEQPLPLVGIEVALDRDLASDGISAVG